MKKLALKVSISFLSLLVFLILLEISLRFIGYLHLSTRTGPSAFGSLSGLSEKDKGGLLPSGDEDYLIMAVGDSFTYGGDSLELNQVYPYILEKKIKSSSFEKKYRVINTGVCEYNSKQLLVRLPGLIEKYNPDMILLLVGATDHFNFAGYSFSEMGLRSFFRDLRVYKMARITFFNLKSMILDREAHKVFSRMRKGSSVGIDGFPLESRMQNAFDYLRKKLEINELSSSPTIVERVWYYFNQGKRAKAIEACQKFLNNDPFDVEILASLAFFSYNNKDKEEVLSFDNILKAKDYLDMALSINPESEFILGQLACLYINAAEFLLKRRKYGYAVDYISSLIELDPRNIGLYYDILKKAYRFQGRQEAVQLAQLFQDIAKSNPTLKQDKLFLKHLKFFENKEKVENAINKQMKRNLEEIAKLCKRQGVELVIQNYPYPYRAANRALRKTALENSLLFIDHAKIFNKKLKNADPYKYLVEDEHCTEKGFQVMAENIFTFLKEEGFLK